MVDNFDRRHEILCFTAYAERRERSPSIAYKRPCIIVASLIGAAPCEVGDAGAVAGWLGGHYQNAVILVAVVPVASTRVARIGRNVPEVTPEIVTFVPDMATVRSPAPPT